MGPATIHYRGIPRALNPVGVVNPPVFTVDGPAHEVVATFVMGAVSIRRTRASLQASCSLLFIMAHVLVDI